MLKKIFLSFALCLHMMFFSMQQQKPRTLELKIRNALVQMYVQQHITGSQYDHGIADLKNLCTDAHCDETAFNTFDELDFKRRAMTPYNEDLYAKTQDILLNFFNTVLPQRVQKTSTHLILETLKQEIESIETSSPSEPPIHINSKKVFNKEEEIKDQEKLTKIVQKLHTHGEISSYQHKKLLEHDIMHEFYITLCNKINDISESINIYYQYYIESNITNEKHIQHATYINKEVITALNDFCKSNSNQKKAHKKNTLSDYFGACESPSAGLNPFFDYHEQEQISPRTSSEEKEIIS